MNYGTWTTLGTVIWEDKPWRVVKEYRNSDVMVIVRQSADKLDDIEQVIDFISDLRSNPIPH